MGRLRVLTRRVLTWIEQPMEMDDKIPHMRVVHGLLRLRLPGGVSVRVIREQPDNFYLSEIIEGRVLKVGQFAADDEMKQLLGSASWHDLSISRDARRAEFSARTGGAQGKGRVRKCSTMLA